MPHSLLIFIFPINAITQSPPCHMKYTGKIDHSTLELGAKTLQAAPVFSGK